MIRPYEGSDFEGIKQVINSVAAIPPWPHYYPGGWSDAKIKQEFEPLAMHRDPLFLVSEEDGKITGLVAGHDFVSFVDNEISHLRQRFMGVNLMDVAAFYLRDIIVHATHQRSIVASKLEKQLKAHALRNGYKRVVTRTPPLNTMGVRFFSGIGYEQLFEDSNPERIYFVKELIKK